MSQDQSPPSPSENPTPTVAPREGDPKRGDQIRMLKTCAEFTETGKWGGLFTYPACGWDLVQSELVTKDKKITTAGKAALYLLGDDAMDPTPQSKAVITYSIPLNNRSDK
jgi:hypothetical protein